ncbi:DUF2591 family protein [Salmonella enterica]|nr:DUF2591 family protein [Salmonella enterica]
MKNYGDMSDSQIAQKVFFFLSGNLCPNGGLAHICPDGFFFFDDKNIKRKFDPCNNPADAWPIITNNFISVIPSTHRDIWFADGQGGETTFDTNPLRAAMIVFLKMNEGKL